MKRCSAFTLAEVLISLALLGVIAALALPQVLQSMQDGKKKAIYRETVSMVSSIMADVYLNNRWTDQTDDTLDKVMQGKLNLLSTEPATMDASDNHKIYYYNLKNGGRMTMHPSDDRIGFSIDYNGQTLPNTLFDDKLHFDANVGSSSYCGLKPGAVGVWNPTACATVPGISGPVQDYYDYYNRMIVN